jgi:phenylacetate-coenzyme A ligase PaaK-like adenylate-forming protein
LLNLPILSRKDIAAQVQKDGSLLPEKSRAQAASTYETTGSTGTPLKVFFSEQNGYYNVLRGVAQFFIDNLPLDRNRARILSAIRSEELKKSSVQNSNEFWAGPLSKIYRTGSNKTLRFTTDVGGLLEQLSKESVGYLICPSRILEQLLDHAGTELIKSLGVEVWFHISDYRSQEAVRQLNAIGVKCLSNYSSAEVGPIAFECTAHEGHYHVAHSNVVVESDEQLTSTFEGEVVCRLLITHLHSYATPLIRYDVGDFGKLHDQCPCGHDGPTLSHIYGRGKHFLRHPDGSYLPFHLTTRALREIVDFSECRFRQETIDTITAYIGGRESLSAAEEEKLRATVIAVSDPAFKVVIKPVKEIDWSDNPKQLFFSSSVV